MMMLVRIDTRRISDWETFHSVFAVVFGFPDFYGRNMNAWIDCMTSLDEPCDGMTQIHAPQGGVVVLALDDVANFSERCPDQFTAIIDSVAFVNHRKIEADEPAVLTLSFRHRR